MGVLFALTVGEPIDFTLAHRPCAVKNGLVHDIWHRGHGVQLRDGVSLGENQLTIVLKSNAGVEANGGFIEDQKGEDQSAKWKWFCVVVDYLPKSRATSVEDKKVKARFVQKKGGNETPIFHENLLDVNRQLITTLRLALV